MIGVGMAPAVLVPDQDGKALFCRPAETADAEPQEETTDRQRGTAQHDNPRPGEVPPQRLLHRSCVDFFRCNA